VGPIGPAERFGWLLSAQPWHQPAAQASRSAALVQDASGGGAPARGWPTLRAEGLRLVEVEGYARRFYEDPGIPVDNTKLSYRAQGEALRTLAQGN
jgi:hypothetical protein